MHIEYPNAIIGITLDIVSIENNVPSIQKRTLLLRYTDGAWFMHQQKINQLIQELNPLIEDRDDPDAEILAPSVDESLAVGIWSGLQWRQDQRDISFEDILNSFDCDTAENGVMEDLTQAVSKAMRLSNADGTPLTLDETQKKIAKIMERVMYHRGMIPKILPQP